MASKVAELLLKIKSSGEETLDKIKESFGALKTAGLAAFAAISAVVVKSIDDYREQEEATNSLTRAMVNNGVYSKQLKDDYLAQASALQALTTYGDEQIISAQGILQRYLGQTKVSKELTQATLDLAAAKKMDLASAAEAVGKAIGTSTNALARNGVEVTANASQQQKLKEVIDGINQTMRGQAAAAAEGLGGLAQFKNVISDLFETVGERLAPVITMFTNKFKGLATDVSITTPIIDAFVGTLHALTNMGVIVSGVFEGVGKLLGTFLADSIAEVSAVIKGNFSEAMDIGKAGMEEYGNVITSTYDKTAERLKEVDQAFLASKQENLAQEEALETESLARRAEVKAEFKAEERSKELELQIAQQEIDMQLLGASEETRAQAQLQARIKAQQNILKATTDARKKLAAEEEIFRLNELQKQAIMDQKTLENRKSTLATISSLQSSNNSRLAAIGKAAAITQIAIETPVAIARALAAFPPPFNFAAAGLVGAAMAAQAANIAGIQMAEGGIVKARPGGIQATIGEGGQDEAVIPLDRAGEFGMGGGGSVTIHFTGPVLGNDSQAREFAVAVDRELLKLRQNNESVSFDDRVS